VEQNFFVYWFTGNKKCAPDPPEKSLSMSNLKQSQKDLKKITSGKQQRSIFSDFFSKEEKPVVVHTKRKREKVQDQDIILLLDAEPPSQDESFLSPLQSSAAKIEAQLSTKDEQKTTTLQQTNIFGASNTQSNLDTVLKDDIDDVIDADALVLPDDTDNMSLDQLIVLSSQSAAKANTDPKETIEAFDENDDTLQETTAFFDNLEKKSLQQENARIQQKLKKEANALVAISDEVAAINLDDDQHHNDDDDLFSLVADTNIDSSSQTNIESMDDITKFIELNS